MFIASDVYLKVLAPSDPDEVTCTNNADEVFCPSTKHPFTNYIGQ
jgi:hypothetical protein